MSAMAEGDQWDAWYVTVTPYEGGISIEGTDWPTDESTLAIRLFIRTDAGLGPQTIGSGASTADVLYRPWYAEPQSWTVSGTMGNGSVIVETIAERRIAGTFSFNASAVSSSADPRIYRVTRGSFDVRY